MIFSNEQWTIETEDTVEGIDSLTSGEEFVHLAKIQGFSKMRGKHATTDCDGQNPNVIRQFRVLDHDGDEIQTDDELRRAMVNKIRSTNILQSPFGQAQKYSSSEANAAPSSVPSQSHDALEKAKVDVICPGCAALSTARLIEMAQGPEAAEEFMKGVMSQGDSDSGYSSSSILSYGASSISGSTYKQTGSGSGASYGFSTQY